MSFHLKFIAVDGLQSWQWAGLAEPLGCECIACVVCSALGIRSGPSPAPDDGLYHCIAK